MSRIGKMPVTVPSGVTVTLEEGNVVRVKSNKGELTEKIPSEIKVSIEEVWSMLSAARIIKGTGRCMVCPVR